MLHWQPLIAPVAAGQWSSTRNVDCPAADMCTPARTLVAVLGQLQELTQAHETLGQF